MYAIRVVTGLTVNLTTNTNNPLNMSKALVVLCLLVFLSILCFSFGWVLGYISGSRKAEDNFCDKYLNDKQ
jgi:hypothetical protein